MYADHVTFEAWPGKCIVTKRNKKASIEEKKQAGEVHSIIKKKRGFTHRLDFERPTFVTECIHRRRACPVGVLSSWYPAVC